MENVARMSKDDSGEKTIVIEHECGYAERRCLELCRGGLNT